MTDSKWENVKRIMKKKNLDIVVANRVGQDCGFDHDDNVATILWRNGKKDFPKMLKVDLANKLVELIAKQFYADSGFEAKPNISIISNNDKG